MTQFTRLGLSLLVITGVLSIAMQRGAAAPPPPAQFVKGEIDRFTALLSRPQAERVEGLRRQVRALFDYAWFTERALGKRWAELPSEQRTRLIAAMQGLLESRYLRKPEVFNKRSISVGAGTVAGEEAQVTATIKHREADIVVLLDFRQKGDGWVVGDVTVDDMSMLDDYRAQFSSFLQKKSVDDLIAKLNAMQTAGTPGADPAGTGTTGK